MKMHPGRGQRMSSNAISRCSDVHTCLMDCKSPSLPHPQPVPQGSRKAGVGPILQTWGFVMEGWLSLPTNTHVAPLRAASQAQLKTLG